ncbi:MAG: FeoB-associated Cys-rich membrane protein [Agathobacter sp.]
MNLGTAIVLLIVAVIVVLAVRTIYRNKKNGKSSCNGDCTNCHGGCR